MELLELRGRVGVLRGQASEAVEKARVAEERLETELSAKKQFEEHEQATVGATKYLCLAWQIYASAHDNQYPTNISQVKNELGGNFEIYRDRLNGLEILSGGSDRNDDAHILAFRERYARQAPDGTWRRVYGLTDGRVVTAASNDGNFEDWEKVNTYSPPPNRDQ